MTVGADVFQLLLVLGIFVAGVAEKRGNDLARLILHAVHTGYSVPRALFFRSR